MIVLLWDLNLVNLNDAQTSSDKKQQVKMYCAYVYACLLSMYTTYVYLKVQEVFRECDVFFSLIHVDSDFIP